MTLQFSKMWTSPTLARRKRHSEKGVRSWYTLPRSGAKARLVRFSLFHHQRLITFSMKPLLSWHITGCGLFSGFYKSHSAYVVWKCTKDTFWGWYTTSKN